MTPDVIGEQHPEHLVSEDGLHLLYRNGQGLPVVFLQRLTNWPAAGQQFARRFRETAAERPEPLERDLDFGARINEVVVVTAGAVRNGAETHDGAGLDGRHEPQPGEHVLGLVADLGR
jgi:hypothetical protein